MPNYKVKLANEGQIMELPTTQELDDYKIEVAEIIIGDVVIEAIKIFNNRTLNFQVYNNQAKRFNRLSDEQKEAVYQCIKENERLTFGKVEYAIEQTIATGKCPNTNELYSIFESFMGLD